MFTDTTYDNLSEFTNDTNFITLAEVPESAPAIEIVIPHTGGGVLTAGGEENQLRDSDSYTVPLATSVDANTVCIVTLPNTYEASTPTITRTGSDLFENADGTDTDIAILGAVKLILTSNGEDKWFVHEISGSRGADGIDSLGIPTEIVTEFPGAPVAGTLYIQTV